MLETIVETLEVKRTALRHIEPGLRQGVLLASNTSTIPIAQLANVLAVPERFCGIHFCNPVRHRRLVEVVRGRETSDVTTATAVAYAKELGKLPIVVRDSPGFLVNRILFPYLRAVAGAIGRRHPAEQIERVALEFGMLLGPLGLYDLIGIDTAFYAGRSMWDKFRDRIVPSPILPALFKAGRLGLKKNIGFYVYDAQLPAPRIDESLTRLVEPYIRQRKSFSDEQLTVRLFVPMLLEASHHRGGSRTGTARYRRRDNLWSWLPRGERRVALLGRWRRRAHLLKMLEPLSFLGPRAAPTRLLVDMARDGTRFY